MVAYLLHISARSLSLMFLCRVSKAYRFFTACLFFCDLICLLLFLRLSFPLAFFFGPFSRCHFVCAFFDFSYACDFRSLCTCFFPIVFFLFFFYCLIWLFCCAHSLPPIVVLFNLDPTKVFCSLFALQMLLSTKSAVAAFAVLCAAALCSAARHSAQRQLPPVIKPKRLSASGGTTIELISPASPYSQHVADPAAYVLGITSNISALYNASTLYGTHMSDVWGYLAGYDADRASDLSGAFGNEQVQAVWSNRGGFGCTRIVDAVEYDVIAANPKVFMGYSDVRCLLAVPALCAVSGPMPVQRHVCGVVFAVDHIFVGHSFPHGSGDLPRPYGHRRVDEPRRIGDNECRVRQTSAVQQ
jgi:hypothetical protein